MKSKLLAATTSSLNPPTYPNPRTGGDGMTMMLASVMSENRRCSVVSNSFAVGP